MLELKGLIRQEKKEKDAAQASSSTQERLLQTQLEDRERDVERLKEELERAKKMIEEERVRAGEDVQGLREALKEIKGGQAVEAEEMRLREVEAREQIAALREEMCGAARERESAEEALAEAKEEAARVLRREREGREVEASALKDALGYVPLCPVSAVV